MQLSVLCLFLFFNDTATTEIYTLSLHDALPICIGAGRPRAGVDDRRARLLDQARVRSEEHTSELQSLTNLVCRLLLETKKRFLSLQRYRSPLQHISYIVDNLNTVIESSS